MHRDLDLFFEKYTPIQNEFIDDDGPWDGCFFETFGDELKFVKDRFEEKPKTVWTIVDEDDELFIAAGFRYVNRLGYLITLEEYEDEDEFYFDIDADNN